MTVSGFSPRACVVWAGEALGTPARVVVDAGLAVAQAHLVGPVWGAAERFVAHAALGEAVVSLSERGSLACYLLLEKEAVVHGCVVADALRDIMDTIWYKLLSEADRARLNARGDVGAAPAPVPGDETR